MNSGQSLLSVLSALVQTMRLKQWTKNFFVLSPLLFSRHLFDVHFRYAWFSFFIFSFVASCVYVLNDIIDVDKDREHPIKKLRPIAAGTLPIPLAIGFIAVILPAALFVAYLISLPFALICLLYFCVNVVYSLFLKETVIIDVMTIAFSFVLRILAGAFAINVPLSEWLLICTSLLALFLGFSKRRHELTLLENDASMHRPVLQEYSTYFLDQMISLVTASTLICYILYTMSDDTISKFHSKNLLLTTPFVLYGLFRYQYLVHQKKTGGDPTSELLTDKPLLLDVCLWALAVILIIYFR
jgi:4-hydroxybenzoate polyprenyltransferase